MLITYNVMNKYIQQIFNIFTVLFLKVHVLWVTFISFDIKFEKIIEWSEVNRISF